MRNHLQFRRGEPTNRCAICDRSFVSFDTIPGGPPSVQGSASIASSPARENDRRWLLPISVARQLVAAGIMRSRNEEAA